MARLIVLGSASAVSNATHDNTHFLLVGDHGSVVLIDCGSNPMGKLERYGIEPNQLNHMILTHFHPDHVYGVPILLMQWWLLGRRAPLQVYGLHHCLQRVETMMADAYVWETWPNFFPVTFNPVAEHENELVLDNEDFLITAWPTKHFVPTIGLRITVKTSGKVIGYSCDTEPIPTVVRLAQQVDLLFHESTGAGLGHSSAAQAGEVASQAEAKRLALIHYEVLNTDPSGLIDEAQTMYSGPVELAEDFMEYEI
jgi:ribonuclease Z